MEEKYKQIINTAIQLFNKYGIRSVSMDDICRERGISKKTLYQFVNSKNDLVEKLLDYKGETIIEIFKESLNKNLNAIDTLIDFSKGLSGFLKDILAHPAARYDMQKYYPDLFIKHTVKRNKEVLVYVIENLKQGIKENLYRDDLDPEVLANLYVKKMEDVASPDFWLDGKYSFKKIYKVMIDSHIRGIANKNGLDYYEENYIKQ